MAPDRKTTVLFADLIGSANLYARAGDAAAQEAIARCVGKLRQAAASCGGRVVKAAGDKMMVLVATADAAADTAVAMHTAVDEFPAVANTRLSLGVGFHYGPVIQQAEEIFGDTVTLASRLVEQAANGQIIITEETLTLLGPLYRAYARRLYAIKIKGRSEEVALCEIKPVMSDADLVKCGATPPRPAARK